MKKKCEEPCLDNCPDYLWILDIRIPFRLKERKWDVYQVQKSVKAGHETFQSMSNLIVNLAGYTLETLQIMQFDFKTSTDGAQVHLFIFGFFLWVYESQRLSRSIFLASWRMKNYPKQTMKNLKTVQSTFNLIKMI